MIKRTLFGKLKNHLNKKEISLIVGPRQAGKTTLMLALKKYAEKINKKTLLLNLDIETDRQFFDSQERLIKKIELEIGKRHGVVFIDEIQRKENADIFLKGIYDMHLPYKFVVSGSGSLELKEKIHESLVGRKKFFELSTLSFEEFVNFKTNEQYTNTLKTFFTLDHIRSRLLLEEYLNFGGYPRVVLAPELDEKKNIIDEIYRSYLEKDIFYLLGIKKTDAFVHLVKILAAQVGRLINYSELSATAGVSIKTLKEYLWYLEKTFIVYKITPYFKNIRKEITKSPMYYFYDIGLRNYSIGCFGNALAQADIGFLFQNFVVSLFQFQAHKVFDEMHFWRTSDGAEVDCILEQGNNIVPCEIKYKTLAAPDVGRSLKNFIKKYRPRTAFVVNLNFSRTIQFNGTKINFMPFFELLKTKV